MDRLAFSSDGDCLRVTREGKHYYFPIVYDLDKLTSKILHKMFESADDAVAYAERFDKKLQSLRNFGPRPIGLLGYLK